tara:strand:+ start:126 stop:476 length:351 start_codon:yes stop_codon:yes gene_type:complete
MEAKIGPMRNERIRYAKYIQKPYTKGPQHSTTSLLSNRSKLRQETNKIETKYNVVHFPDDDSVWGTNSDELNRDNEINLDEFESLVKEEVENSTFIGGLESALNEIHNDPCHRSSQ